MKILDKIIISPTPPTSKNVAWFDGEEIKVPNQGEWKSTGGSSIMINVTYEELVRLRNEGKLTPGAKYRMTDYETTCTWENTQVAGHPFDLVLTALDNKTLDEKCSAIWSERDTDGYFANSNLPAWDVRYCLDNDKGRFDWALMGGTIVKISAYDAPFTFDGIYTGGTWEISGVVYYMWGAFVDGERAFPFFTTSLNPSVGDEIYLSNTGESIDGTGSVVDAYEQAGGKGVIYRLVDEWDNSVPYDFKNIMFSRPLTEGKYDEENGVNTFCYTFCCIDSETFKIEDQSVKEGFCCNNRIEVWSFNNVFLTFLHQRCYNNTLEAGCYYNTFGTNCYLNSFGEECHDNFFEDNCTNNTFGPASTGNTLKSSTHNTFGYACSGNSLISSSHNIFGNNCRNNSLTSSPRNTFENSCSNNSLGKDSSNNTFGDECSNNTLVGWCVQNVFSGVNTGNTLGQATAGCYFGYASQNNTLGSKCYFTYFDAHCSDNSIGEDSRGNRFDIYCTNNTLGTHCSDNKFDKVCRNNTLANYCSSNIFGRYSEYITLGESGTGFYATEVSFKNCSYINLTSDSSGSMSAYIEYYSIFNVSGKSSSQKTEIVATRKRTYQTYVTTKKDGTVVEYTVDDILNTQSSTPV